MKTLLKITLLFFVCNIYGQNERPYQMDRQLTYVDSAKFYLDDSTNVANDYSKSATWTVVSPKIKHETSSSSTLSGTSTYVRFGTGGNTEYYTQLKYISPEIDDLSVKGAALVGSDKIAVNTSGTDYSSSMSAVNTYIASIRDEAYILNLLTTDTTITIVVAPTTYGYIYLQKIGKQVNGNVRITTDSDLGESTIEASFGTFAPSYDISYKRIEGASANYLRLDSDKTFIMFLDIDDADMGIQSFGIGYITP